MNGIQSARHLRLPLRAFTFDGRPRTLNSATGWLITAAMMLLAVAVRLPRLGQPARLIFDETYYVKGAYSLLHQGFEGRWIGERSMVDTTFASGLDINLSSTQADYVVHGQLGKWILALGQLALGNTPAGWRFACVICGVISVGVLVRIALMLFDSWIPAALAGLALSLDGVSIVLSRTALLDGPLAMMCLIAIWMWLKDAHAIRVRSVWEKASAKALSPLLGSSMRNETDMRVVGGIRGSRAWRSWRWRPWLIGVGFTCGLACGIKWSPIYLLAALGIAAWMTDLCAARHVGALGVGALRSMGRAFAAGVCAFIQLVPIAVLGYLLSWSAWWLNPHSWGRTYSPSLWRSFWHYHQQMWEFHTGLSTPHTYQSSAWAWLLQLRPVSFSWQRETVVAHGEKVPLSPHESVQAVTSLGNIALWWPAALGLIALVVIVAWRFACTSFSLLRKKYSRSTSDISRNTAHFPSWRNISSSHMAEAVIFVGYAGLWVPWLLYPDRTIFQFYSVVFAPFAALVMAYWVNWLLSFSGISRSLARKVVTAYALAIVLTAAFWYPLWCGISVPAWFWQIHMWFNSWV